MVVDQSPKPLGPQEQEGKTWFSIKERQKSLIGWFVLGVSISFLPHWGNLCFPEATGIGQHRVCLSNTLSFPFYSVSGELCPNSRSLDGGVNQDACHPGYKENMLFRWDHSDSFLLVKAMGRVSLFGLSECNLGTVSAIFMPHVWSFLKQERMMLPSRETEKNKFECGGRPPNIACVPGSSHTCGLLDLQFMWINKFSLFNRISVIGNWKNYD